MSPRTTLSLLLLGGLTAGAQAPCTPRNLSFQEASAGWAHKALSKLKRDTRYSFTTEGDLPILHAEADDAASFFVARFPAPVAVPAVFSWKWRTMGPVPGADNRDKDKEDAPLRVIIAFDGDRASLPEVEQKRFKRAKTFFGSELPFAVLMYTWTDQVPQDTVIPSAHTSQVKMIAIAPGPRGAWQSVRRDVAADYRRAWGASPGAVLGVAVMTDTDNTGEKAVGDYADLRFECPR